MTKYEIEIDLPADVLERYEPVEVRRARHGDVYFSPSGKVSTWLPDFETAMLLVILRPIATWDEWPEWLTSGWVAMDAGFGGSPPEWWGHELKPEKCEEDNDWDCKGHIVRLKELAKHTNLTLPEYDGPWEHSLIRNPHLGQGEPVAVDTDGEVKPVAAKRLIEAAGAAIEWSLPRKDGGCFIGETELRHLKDALAAARFGGRVDE